MFDFGWTNSLNFALDAMKGANYDNTEFFDPHAFDSQGRYGITDADRKLARLEGLGTLGAGLTKAAFAKDWAGVGEGIGAGLIGGSQANRGYLDQLSKTKLGNAETAMKFKQANATLRNTELAGDTAEFQLGEMKERDELEDQFSQQVEPMLSGLEAMTPTLGLSTAKAAEYKANIASIRARILGGDMAAAKELGAIISTLPEERQAELELKIEEQNKIREANRNALMGDVQAFNQAKVPWTMTSSGPQMISPQDAAAKAASLAYTQQATASSRALEEDRQRGNQSAEIKQANAINALYGDYEAAKATVGLLSKQLSPANQGLRRMPQASVQKMQSDLIAAQSRIADIRSQLSGYNIDPEQGRLPLDQILGKVRGLYSTDPNLQPQENNQDMQALAVFNQIRGTLPPGTSTAIIIDHMAKKLGDPSPQNQAAFKKQMLLLLQQQGIQ